LAKQVLETALKAEMDERLGYARGDRTDKDNW
jgi:transposase-like protein